MTTKLEEIIELLNLKFAKIFPILRLKNLYVIKINKNFLNTYNIKT
jgi:hypothetical protein